MQKTMRYLVALGLSSQLFIACKREAETDISPEQSLAIPELSGYVQKGPYVVGTEVIVSELDKNLGQTGKTFHATIKDDQGAFSLSNVKLKSNHVELRANGFYFNEVTGKLSSAPLALSALADVAATASVNVNMLTHLEKGRVEYLMSNDKKSFAEAKKQAQTEILAIFNVVKANMPPSERLNIAQAGEDHAILLALSAIIQGTRTESEVSELLAKIRLDIREDGKLDNAVLQSALINEATLLNQGAVRSNVTKRYADLGLTVMVGNFEKYVQHFVTNSPFAFNKKVHYPATGQYGVNLLAPAHPRLVVARAANHHWFNQPTFTQSFSLSALAPPGVGVRVKITPLTQPTVFDHYSVATPNAWRMINNGQELEITKPEELTEGEFRVNTYGTDSLMVRFEVFENNASLPTTVRNLVFVGDPAPSPNDKIEYPGMPMTFGNLLDPYHTQYTPSHFTGSAITQYLYATIPPGQTLKVRITSTALPDSVSRFSLNFNIPPHENTWRSTGYSYNGRTEVHEIEATRSGAQVGCGITPLPGQQYKSATIEVFENGAVQPTRVSQVTNWR